MRILIVDDDGFFGEMTSAILEEAGYQTVMVESGLEAVELLAGDPGFDGVISDMHMPLVSGLELFEMLREEGCNVPFILLSGENPSDLLQRQPRLDACLAKDGDLEHALPATLGRILAART